MSFLKDSDLPGLLSRLIGGGRGLLALLITGGAVVPFTLPLAASLPLSFDNKVDRFFRLGEVRGTGAGLAGGGTLYT